MPKIKYIGKSNIFDNVVICHKSLRRRKKQEDITKIKFLLLILDI